MVTWQSWMLVKGTVVQSHLALFKNLVNLSLPMSFREETQKVGGPFYLVTKGSKQNV